MMIRLRWFLVGVLVVRDVPNRKHFHATIDSRSVPSGLYDEQAAASTGPATWSSKSSRPSAIRCRPARRWHPPKRTRLRRPAASSPGSCLRRRCARLQGYPVREASRRRLALARAATGGAVDR
jgi:hypothetical protein